MNVGEICSRDVDLVDLDETARDAARRMLERQVGTLLALEGGRPVGIVTDRDVALRVVAADRAAAATPVREIVSRPVRSVVESASLEDAIAAFRAGACRRLAVVDAAGALVGIVALDDVLSVFADDLRRIAGLLEREAPHPGAARL
jgi:CBS domain-containing protein